MWQGAATKPTMGKHDKIHLARRSYVLRGDGDSALPSGSSSIYELSPSLEVTDLKYARGAAQSAQGDHHHETGETDPYRLLRQPLP